MFKNIGLQTRYNRIVNPTTGRTLMVPFDHGIAFGPVSGIEDPQKTARLSAEGGADAIVFQTGLAAHLYEGHQNKCGTVFKLTNGCIHPHQTLLSTVEDAIRLGADAVSVEVVIGSTYEEKMLINAQKIYSSCLKWNIPLLIMLYYDESALQEGRTPSELIAHTARVGAELGAHIVKVAYTGDKESFKK